MRKGKIKIIAGVLVFGLLASGCQSTGGDKAAETTVTETPKVTETATPTPEPTKEVEIVEPEEVNDDTSDQKDSDKKSEEDQDTSQEKEDNNDNENNEETQDNQESEDGANKAVIQVWESRYIEDCLYDPLYEGTACEIEISNVTDTSFDFSVYERNYDLEEASEEYLIFNTNTATFLPGGTEAIFKGKEYTLHFTFPDYHHAYPYATDMEVTGFGPLEGKSYSTSSIPGYGFS